MKCVHEHVCRILLKQQPLNVLCEMHAWVWMYVYDFIEATADELSLWNSCWLLKRSLEVTAAPRYTRQTVAPSGVHNLASRGASHRENLSWRIPWGETGPNPSRHTTCRTLVGRLSCPQDRAGISHRWVLEEGPPSWHVLLASHTWVGGKLAPDSMQWRQRSSCRASTFSIAVSARWRHCGPTWRHAAGWRQLLGLQLCLQVTGLSSVAVDKHPRWGCDAWSVLGFLQSVWTGQQQGWRPGLDCLLLVLLHPAGSQEGSCRCHVLRMSDLVRQKRRPLWFSPELIWHCSRRLNCHSHMKVSSGPTPRCSTALHL